MNYFAYIESPLQAFNLMEYTGFANIEIDILIINKKNPCFKEKLSSDIICDQKHQNKKKLLTLILNLEREMS